MSANEVNHEAQLAFARAVQGACIRLALLAQAGEPTADELVKLLPVMQALPVTVFVHAPPPGRPSPF
jgi:hypothetical protein